MATSFYPGIVMDFDDTAFEPNAGYIFDESSGTDQLQRDIEASYTSNGIDDRDASRSASLTWGYVSYGAVFKRPRLIELLRPGTN